MDIADLLSWLQIVSAVILSALILIQPGGDEGLGGAFGGGGGGTAYHTRRGLEKGIFIATIIMGIIFGALAISSLILGSP